MPYSDRKIEIRRDEKLTEISVKYLKDILYEAMDLSQDTHHIVYAGRVLNDSRKIADYNIRNGVTLFAMKKRIQPPVDKDVPKEPYRPDFVDLMQDPRVQNIVHRIMYNRGLMRSALTRVPPELADYIRTQSATQQYDAERISQMFVNSPPMVAVGQLMMESFLNSRGGNPPPYTRDEFITRLDEAIHNETDDSDESESEGESDETGSEDELMEQVAESQQQMYEQSQALLAHEHRQQEGSEQQQPSAPEPVDQTSGSQSVSQTTRHQPSGSHSVDQTSRQQPSGSHPVDQRSRQQPSGSQLASRNPQHQAISQERLSSVLASLGEIPSQTPPAHQPGTSSGQPSTQGILSADMLSQALASAMFPQGTPPHTTQPPPPPGAQIDRNSRAPTTHPSGSSATFQEKKELFRQQLNQLHSMGIKDDAACLHALEATKGNVEAALELLMGGM